MASEIESGVRSLGLELGDETLRKLERFRDLIFDATARFNLTAVRDRGGIGRRHIVESLAFAGLLAEHELLHDGTRVLDIGAGAGLPGVPLKIAYPGVKLSLLESNAKKCEFLREAAAALRLDGVEVLEGRAEGLGHKPRQREAYDLVVARAVAPLPVLLEYALPFLREGGHLAASKGSAAPSELAAAANALRVLHGEVSDSLDFSPPEGLAQTVIVVRKIGPTPAAYPRRDGVPAKRPL